MSRTKIDGVIEAVRYTPAGEISLVRTYIRRGAVWSDHILLGRPELAHRLESGLHFVTGQRKENLGSVFETGPAVLLMDGHILTSAQPAAHDQLAGLPVF
ncbi:MAG: hypothetical protein WCE68_00755 [Anaerolineales bacterium]